MDTVAVMRTFIAVVESGSFTGAAARLDISTALASKYVTRLETRLGVRLLTRTTRSLSLTELGRVYFEQARELIEDFDELEASIENRHATPSGRLQISAPVTFAEMHLTAIVGQFLDRYPSISVDLRLTDRFVNLVDEGVDLAIRIGELADSNLMARRLSTVRIIPCASPAYLERHGTPTEPSDLAKHACIVDTNFNQVADWPFIVDGEHTSVQVTGRFGVNSARALRRLILDGYGIGVVPTYAIGDAIASGEAVPLLTDFEPQPMAAYAVYPYQRHLAAKVRTFIDFLVETLGDPPRWDRF